MTGLSFLSPLQDFDGWGVGSGVENVTQGQGWEVMPQVLPDLNKHLIKISLVFNIAFSIPKS